MHDAEKALREYEELEALMLEEIDEIPEAIYNKMMRAQEKRNKAMETLTSGYNGGLGFPNF